MQSACLTSGRIQLFGIVLEGMHSYITSQATVAHLLFTPKAYPALGSDAASSQPES